MTAAFLKAGFLMVGLGFAMLLVPFAAPLVFRAPLDVTGVAFADDLEKKPRIEACLFEDTLELCFLRVGGALAGVASLLLSRLTIMA